MSESLPVKNTLRYWDMIQAAADDHGLPDHEGLSGAHILAGLVCQESAGIPMAERPEPHYRWLFGDDAHERPRLRLPWWGFWKRDLYLQRISRGLCQVMGAVAREYGFGGPLASLCWDPAVGPALGLRYGARHLAQKLKGTNNMRRALLRYNGGGDPEYPDKVLNWAKEIKDSGHTECPGLAVSMDGIRGAP